MKDTNRKAWELLASKRAHILPGIGFLLALSALALPTLARTNQYDLVIGAVVGGGGVTSAGGAYSTRATIGEPLVGTIAGGDYSIGAGFQTIANNSVLVGHATWQGRPTQPNALQQLPITITLKLGTTEVNYSAQTSNASGYFTVSLGSNLPPGTYNWRVKGPDGAINTLLTDPPGFLSNCGTVVLAGSAQTNVEMGTMRAGDANNDDILSIVDFNILKNTFGRAFGDTGYDNRADFTGDLLVSITDFNLLKQNFGASGCASQ